MLQWKLEGKQNILISSDTSHKSSMPTPPALGGAGLQDFTSYLKLLC